MSIIKNLKDGLKWNTFLDISSQVFQIFFTALLARILTKDDFGIVAIVLIVNRFFKTVTNLGFGSAIIRSVNLTNNQISGVFYIQFIINVIISWIIYFSSDWISEFFNNIILSDILKISTWIITLESFKFPGVLLRRRLCFKEVAVINLITLIVANGVAIYFAIAGLGVWSLVIRLFVSSILSGALMWRVAGWFPSRTNFKGLRDLFTFGLDILGSNVVSFFAQNAINIITGKWLGTEVLGVFTIAYNLAILPAQKIKNVVAGVLTPVLAKLQSKPTELAINVKKVFLNVFGLFIPFMGLLAGMRKSIILLMYGNEWSGAIGLLGILVIVGATSGLAHIWRSSLMSVGESRVILFSTLVEVLFSVPIMYLLLDDLQLYGLLFAYLIGSSISGLYIYIRFIRCFKIEVVMSDVAAPSALALIFYGTNSILSNINLPLVLSCTLQILSTSLLLIVYIRNIYPKLWSKIILRINGQS